MRTTLILGLLAAASLATTGASQSEPDEPDSGPGGNYCPWPPIPLETPLQQGQVNAAQTLLTYGDENGGDEYTYTVIALLGSVKVTTMGDATWLNKCWRISCEAETSPEIVGVAECNASHRDFNRILIEYIPNDKGYVDFYIYRESGD